MEKNNTKILAVWSLETEQVLQIFESSVNGISTEDVSERTKKYGQNILHTTKPVSAFSVFVNQFANPLIFILIIAGVFTGVLAEWVDMGVIFLAVFINTGLGFYREYHAEHTIEKLATYMKERSRVIRDGREQEIDSALLVPGDIVHLAYGSRVPADARIISENNVKVDESILTGESIPISKNTDVLSEGVIMADRKNMVFAGTLVVEGYATAMIVSTGGDTELGKIALLVSETKRERTPIQKGLWRLAWLIFFIVIGIVIFLFFLGISRGESVISMLVLTSAISVGAVPEALPIALTVILAIGAERIAKKKGVIRSLSAAETLGSTTVIMTDKTGTLTQAKMELVAISPVTQLLSGEYSKTLIHSKLSPDQKTILEHALVCVDVVITNPEAARTEWTFTGHPFETNIVAAARNHAIDIVPYLSLYSPLLSFNSTNKFSVSKKDDTYIIMGAPDILLSKSTVSKDDFLKIQKEIEKISEAGGRLIGIALLSEKKGKHIIAGNVDPSKVTDLEFLGLMVFNDPIRPEVPAVIEKIQSYGTRIVMVTGDLKGTALSVAKQIGWTVSPGEILSGEEIRSISDEELLANLKHIKIFNRVTPEDKLRIGTLLKKSGEVVAMTGDGVNDAPALKAMDVGVALGSGSDVAKSAADIVLLDDNFETIAAAIEEGRRLLANIRKIFVYLMSNSLDEVILVGGSLIVGIPLPLSALQIIWVNMFTGSLPAISFAFDENYDGHRMNVKSLHSLFSLEVKWLTFGVGIFTSALLFVMYYILITYGIPVEIARSVLFVCFASYILVVAFSFRSLYRPLFSYPLFNNRQLNISILIAIVLLVVTMTVPVVRDLFGLTALSLSWWWVVLVWLIINVAIVEFAKWCFRLVSK